MLFSSRLSNKDLIELCRSLRFSLKSGLMLRETMELIATKGPWRLRRIADKITHDLKAGWDLRQSLQKHKYAFPPVFLALVEVGEESGNLPEILGHLEEYYMRQEKLGRELVSELSWPVFELVMCIVVVTALIYFMGVVQAKGPRHAAGEPPIEPIGFGLIGKDGAIKFLTVVLGTVFGVAALYWLAKRLLRRWAPIESVLRYIPVLGSCSLAIVMTRFCVAFRLMLETNISILKTMRLALLATDNQLFMNAIPKAETALRKGNTIPGALEATRVFPESFLGVAAIADATGQLPEALDIQAREYDDFARRRLLLLNRILSWSIWLLVAVCIGTAIFRIFLRVYYTQLTQFDQLPPGPP
jgi:type II secretory pathway component PulF